ncbi:hypothetical protein [Kribbella deserti]|uniref:DUF3592 domain-containing protein n=1 Tax=Kribbella deserti TaxID=1926257 RepID=A0ABV6QNL9_9ACTN
MESLPRRPTRPWDHRHVHIGVLRLGAVALLVALIGVVIALDTADQRNFAQKMLAAGVPATATEVVLKVSDGKGGKYVDAVRVTIPTSDGQSRQAELAFSLAEPEGAEPGRRTPAAGSRYAAPLAVLYDPSAPSELIATVDARSFATADEPIWIGKSMALIGFSVVLGCLIHVVIAARRRGHRWSWWGPSPPRRH